MRSDHGGSPPPNVPAEAFAAAPDVLTGAVPGAVDHELLALPRVLGDAPVAVLVVDRAAGEVVYANPAASVLAGGAGLPMGTDRWAEAVGLRDVDGAQLASSGGPLSQVAAGEPVAGEAVRLRSAGSVDRGSDTLLWVTGFPLAPTADGSSLSLVVFLPVSGSRRGGPTSPGDLLQALRERAVVASDVCFTISDPRQPGNPLVWVNPAFTRVTGYAEADVLGRNCDFLQGPATDPAAVQQIRDELRAGGSTTVTLLNYRPDGTAFWNQLSISPVHDGAGELVSFVGVQSDVTQRVAAEEERARALAAERSALQAERAARVEVEQVRARLLLMSEAGAALTSTLDTDELLQRLAGLCVPALADWLTVVQVRDDGVVSRVATRHRDGDGAAELLAQVSAHYIGRTLPADAPAAGAIAAQTPVVRSGLTAPALRRFSRGLDDDVFAELGSGSLAAIPLTGREGVWGALVLVREDPAGFSRDALDVATDLARRAGQALDNARMFDRQASVAETLQRALLPELPELPGITAAAHYAAASSAAAVGGDFYDLLVLPDGAVGILIGDVAGHDIAAAAAMGQLRNLLRAAAWDSGSPDPAGMLGRVDTLMDVLGIRDVITAIVLRVTPPRTADGRWTVECSNAGHPPVLVRTPAGEVHVLSASHDLLLGADPGRPRTTTTHHVAPGTQLVLYTDGLVELTSGTGGRARDLDQGTAQAVAALEGLPTTATTQDVVDTLSLLAAGSADDVALLAVQLGSAAT